MFDKKIGRARVCVFLNCNRKGTKYPIIEVISYSGPFTTRCFLTKQNFNNLRKIIDEHEWEFEEKE